MFGCHALWVSGNVFALVWKHGRIGVKLPKKDDFNALISQEGAEPWKAGTMTMSHWILVPIGFHKKQKELGKWVKRGHALCSELEKKPAKPKTAKVKKKK